MTVVENIMLGAESGAILAGSVEKARAELRRLARDYSLEVDPDALAGELPVGQQQRVEILKALYRGADILILDEPTGVLTRSEEHTSELQSLMRISYDVFCWKNKIYIIIQLKVL